jgi:hypothetical protein
MTTELVTQITTLIVLGTVCVGALIWWWRHTGDDS